jgi:short-subunit dehydrogenase
MSPVVVVTGSSAGAGRAIAAQFATHGYAVGLLARSHERLEATAAALAECGASVCPVSADVADPAAVENAADRIESQLGPIAIWVNNAMATAFAPFNQLNADEFRRGTEVTYLGTVYGTMAALRRMRAHGYGTIVQVSSALSYRATPLQSIYCGAKFAIRGFTESLRTELLHERSKIHMTMIHLPAINTPQFDWALNRTGQRARPVPPVFDPEVAARAVFFGATHRRRDVWVGWPTVKAIVANTIAPGFLDRMLAQQGYHSQTTDEPLPIDAPGNLFESPAGSWGSHGRFGTEARRYCSTWTSEQRGVLALTTVLLGAVGLLRVVSRRH